MVLWNKCASKFNEKWNNKPVEFTQLTVAEKNEKRKPSHIQEFDDQLLCSV